MHLSARWVALGASLLALSITLAACVSAPDPATAPYTSNSPSPSATTPRPSPTSAGGDPAAWVITFDGVGPLVLGGSLATGLPATTAQYDVAPADSCPNPATSILQSDSNPTIWIQSVSENADEVGLIAVGGDVLDARTSGSPRTEEGIAVGSSLDDVRAAYPTGTLGETLDSEASRIVVQATDVAQGERYLVFELFEDVVQTIFVQTNPELVHEFCG